MITSVSAPQRVMWKMPLLLVVVLALFGCTLAYHFPRQHRTVTVARRLQKMALSSDDTYLLPNPAKNAVGNFFNRPHEDESARFLQCYMLALANIGTDQYGVGYPVDVPVMILEFVGNDLRAVNETTFEKYDHLVDYIGNQMDINGFQLFPTPHVLTLQGEFEDEKLNDLFPSNKEGDDDEDEEEEEYEDDDEEELTLSELIARESARIEEEGDDPDDEEEEEEEEEDYTDDDEEDTVEEDEDDKFWNSSPTGLSTSDYDHIPDYSIIEDCNITVPINEDAIITEEDTRALRRAHKKADRVLEYAEDVGLIASFSFCKQSYHLVRILEVSLTTNV